jgi:hypothetical protein
VLAEAVLDDYLIAVDAAVAWARLQHLVFFQDPDTTREDLERLFECMVGCEIACGVKPEFATLDEALAAIEAHMYSAEWDLTDVEWEE